MKYRFSLSPAVKTICEWTLQNYKSDKRLLETMKTDLISCPIVNYGEITGNKSGMATRSTENAAIRMISVPYLNRIENSIEAVERALEHADQTDRQLVTLVYWKQSHSVEGAAIQCNLSKSAAYQRLNAILGCIAFHLGYITTI